MMTLSAFAEFLIQLGHQTGAKNGKNLAFHWPMCCTHKKYHCSVQCYNYIFLPKLHKPFATTGYGDHPCCQMPVQKASHMEGISNDQWKITWWCSITWVVRMKKTRRRRRSGGRVYWGQSKFFAAVQGIEAVRKFIQEFDVEDDMLMMCSKLKTSYAHWSTKKNVTI